MMQVQSQEYPLPMFCCLDHYLHVAALLPPEARLCASGCCGISTPGIVKHTHVYVLKHRSASLGGWYVVGHVSQHSIIGRLIGFHHFAYTYETVPLLSTLRFVQP